MEKRNHSSKLAASNEADQALDSMLSKINDGFQGGKVNKGELLSWVVIRFQDRHLPSAIEEIRRDHFDEIAYLQSVIKTARIAKRTSQGPADLAKLLSPITSKRDSKKEPRNRAASEQGGSETGRSQLGTSE